MADSQDVVDAQIIDGRIIVEGRELWWEPKQGPRGPAVYLKHNRGFVWVEGPNQKPLRLSFRRLAELESDGDINQDRGFYHYFMVDPENPQFAPTFNKESAIAAYNRRLMEEANAEDTPAIDVEVAQEWLPPSNTTNAEDVVIAADVADVEDVADAVTSDPVPTPEDNSDLLDLERYTEAQVQEMHALHRLGQYANDGIGTIIDRGVRTKNSQLVENAIVLNFLFLKWPAVGQTLLLNLESELFKQAAQSVDPPKPTVTPDSVKPTVTPTPPPPPPPPPIDPPVAKAEAPSARQQPAKRPLTHGERIHRATLAFLDRHPNFRTKIVAYLASHPELHHIKSEDLLFAVFGFRDYDRSSSLGLAEVMRSLGWRKTVIHSKLDISLTWQGWRKEKTY